jgi:hypothetical protein
MDILHTTCPSAPQTSTSRRIEVTEMDADALSEYVHSHLGDATVRLERRANRTYLIADGVNC